MVEVPRRQIRAVFDDTTVRVYQAHGDAIAEKAPEAGRSSPCWIPRRSASSWIRDEVRWSDVFGDRRFDRTDRVEALGDG